MTDILHLFFISPSHIHSHCSDDIFVCDLWSEVELDQGIPNAGPDFVQIPFERMDIAQICVISINKREDMLTKV